MELSIPNQFENAQETARVAAVGDPRRLATANDGGVRRQDPQPQCGFSTPFPDNQSSMPIMILPCFGSCSIATRRTPLSAASRHYFSSCKFPKAAVLNIYVVRVCT